MNILSMAMAGGSSPVTLAGTLVTHNAGGFRWYLFGTIDAKRHSCDSWKLNDYS